MVQLWVNLPAKDKMSRPKYQGILNKDIPKVNLPHNAGLVEVIAGNYQGVQGKASTFSPVYMLNAKLNNNGKAEFNLPEHFNTGMIVIKGSIKVNESDEVVATDHFVLFENKGENFTAISSALSMPPSMSTKPIFLAASPVQTLPSAIFSISFLKK